MKFLKWLGLLGFLFFISCEKKDMRKQQEGVDQVLREYEEQTKKLEPLSLEEQNSENIKCNISNYETYVFDSQKMAQLISDTGKGCYLPGVDFSNKNLTNAIFTKSHLKGAIFEGAVLTKVKFMGATLQNAVLESANYWEAYFDGAILQGATYNKKISAGTLLKGPGIPGIRNPAERGMIYVDSTN